MHDSGLGFGAGRGPCTWEVHGECEVDGAAGAFPKEEVGARAEGRERPRGLRWRTRWFETSRGTVPSPWVLQILGPMSSLR